jgi:hypothetical protein
MRGQCLNLNQEGEKMKNPLAPKEQRARPAFIAALIGATIGFLVVVLHHHAK